MSNYFSQKVTAFHGRSTPESGFLAGYALLITVIEESGRKVPLPDRLAIITENINGTIPGKGRLEFGIIAKRSNRCSRPSSL